jgi:hypothetical protein
LEIARVGRYEMPPSGSFSSNVASPIISFPSFCPHTSLRAQPSFESFNEKKRKEADHAVRRFWYNHSLPFNLANSHFFQPMVDVIAIVGRGYKTPFYKL